VVARIKRMTDNSAHDEIREERPPEIALTNVAKVYNAGSESETIAVSGANLALHAGQLVSLVGPSGCGKTTLLRICAGLLEPSHGTVEYRGSVRRPEPSMLGTVFQKPALLPWLNVQDNVTLPGRIWRLDPEQTRKRAEVLLGMMHLNGVSAKYPKELSGGMQQRVAIARALLNEPSVLFMDEPFGALDAMTREKLNRELSQLHREHRKTILFVTHDIREAVFLSDRVVVLSNRPAKIIEDIAIDIPEDSSLNTRSEEEMIPYITRIRRLLEE